MVLREPLGLAYVDREQPLRNVATLSAGLLAEAVQPLMGALPDVPVEILKVAVWVAALKLLEPWDGPAPHESRLRRESSGGIPGYWVSLKLYAR